MNLNPKVLITDAVHPIIIEKFELNKFEVNYQPEYAYNDVFSVISEYSILVINSKITVDKKLMDRARCLKIVGRLGSGKEVIDLEYASQMGIMFFNSPEGNRDAVAEHAMGLLLSLLHKIHIAAKQTENKIWIREENRGVELKGKIVGIIGYGNTGMEMAKRLSSFGVKVLSYDKYKFDYVDEYTEEVEMSEIFENADIISFHIPLTKETKHLINKNWLTKFKKPIYLINTSRGSIIHTPSLIEGLENGSIRGAAVDVIENEFLSSFSYEENLLYMKLVSCENVIITPHIAGWTFESKYKLADTLSEKIIESWNNQ